MAETEIKLINGKTLADTFARAEIEELKDKVPDSGGNVDLDTTLTQSGKAADAKATGDAIKQLAEDGALYGAELDMRMKPSKNLNVTPYDKTYTRDGITFVTHDDNSVTISGKAE